METAGAVATVFPFKATLNAGLVNVPLDVALIVTCTWHVLRAGTKPFDKDTVLPETVTNPEHKAPPGIKLEELKTVRPVGNVSENVKKDKF